MKDMKETPGLRVVPHRISRGLIINPIPFHAQTQARVPVVIVCDRFVITPGEPSVLRVATQVHVFTKLQSGREAVYYLDKRLPSCSG